MPPLMPDFDVFSQWLATISVHHWVLPTIGSIKAGGWPHPWTPAALGFPTEPFVQLWDWNDADGFGHIRTRDEDESDGYKVRDVGRHCLEAVYRRFEQLAIHGPVGAGRWALINGAYNMNLRKPGTGHLKPYCWQVGAYPGPAVFATCPDHILCPFLAPIMFLFCGVSSGPATPAAATTYHNNAAHDFASRHGLVRYTPVYSHLPAPAAAELPQAANPKLEALVRRYKELDESDSTPPPESLGNEGAYGSPCEQCPLWQLLATDPQYRDWTETRTIGGRKTLEFRYVPECNEVEIRLPRPAGNEVQDYPKTFSELQFKVMCGRF